MHTFIETPTHFYGLCFTSVFAIRIPGLNLELPEESWNSRWTFCGRAEKVLWCYDGSGWTSLLILEGWEFRYLPKDWLKNGERLQNLMLGLIGPAPFVFALSWLLCVAVRPSIEEETWSVLGERRVNKFGCSRPRSGNWRSWSSRPSNFDAFQFPRFARLNRPRTFSKDISSD